MKNAVFACMIFVASGSLYAVDFIRGDVNGDGVVSIADAYILFHYQERRSEIDTAIPRPVQSWMPQTSMITGSLTKLTTL